MVEGHASPLEALIAVGPVALPVVLRRMRSDPTCDSLLCEALAAWGPHSASAAEHLVHRMTIDSSLEHIYRRALVRMGAGSVGALMSSYEGAAAPGRLRILRTLEALAESATPALPLLRRELSSVDAAIRDGAASALRSVALGHVNKAVAALGTREKLSPRMLAELGALSAGNREREVELSRRLVGMLDDGNEDVRATAIDLLGNLPHGRSHAIPALRAILRVAEDPLHDAAAEALLNLGDDEPVAIQSMLARAHYLDPWQKLSRAEVLSRGGASASMAALRFVEETIQSDDRAVREESARILLVIAPTVAAAAKRLAKSRLQVERDGVVLRILESIERLPDSDL